MHAIVLASFSRWWSRLLGRPDPTPVTPPPQSPVSSEPGVAVISPVAELAPPRPGPVTAISRVDENTLKQALLSTLSQAALGEPAPPSPTLARHAADPVRRAATLESLQHLDQIPSLQSLARSFTNAIEREDASFAEVASAVEKDPALCVRILRLANSAAISPVERINDIASAIHMLGLLRVRRAARMVFTLRDAHAVTEGFDWRHLWIHGLATAALAEELERQLALPADPQLHLAALLHDVGKIVLSTVDPETYRTVLIAAWQGTERLDELESTHLGVSHAEAGVIFAERCNLHPAIMASIAHHASPLANNQHELTATLAHLANFVSKSYGLGFSGARLEACDGEFETLPAWSRLAELVGREIDPEQIAENLHLFIGHLKTELQHLSKIT